VNLFDVVILVLVAVAVLIGIGSGALPQVGGLAGAFAGAVLAVVILPLLAGPLANIDPQLRAFVVLGGILFIIGIGEAIGSAVGRLAANRVRGSVLGTLDRALGGIVGGIQALLVAWLIGGLLATGPMRSLAGQASNSLIIRGLNGVLPAPTEIAVDLGRLLDDTGIPDLFVGLEPIPAPDVQRPTDPAAQAIAAAAEASTFVVAARTCQFESSGTGFVVARGYIVTNAHVVAGASTVRVRNNTFGAHDAIVVFDDPELDVALLLVRQLEALPLRFATSNPGRGAIGATLGYPHGGPLTISAAAVSGSYDAQGRDIYGEKRVSRTILELRAVIDQGDSGGPLILGDGTVGGVVFAEARTDENVGYALSPVAVATEISSQIGRTGGVDTGACIR
jgi:S1-C subfamily serine protease